MEKVINTWQLTLNIVEVLDHKLVTCGIYSCKVTREKNPSPLDINHEAPQHGNMMWETKR